MKWGLIELSAKNFFQEIQQDKYPVLVEFWSPRCPACRMMDPLLEDIANEKEGKIMLRKLNADLYKATSEGLNVFGVPTYILFCGGKERWRQVGAVSKSQLLEILEQFT